MHLVCESSASPADRSQSPAPVLSGGLAGWLFAAIENFARKGNAKRRQMEVLETLPLGGRRQLLLVRCGRERFLVGTGSDAVSTVTRVEPDRSAARQAEGRRPLERDLATVAPELR